MRTDRREVSPLSAAARTAGKVLLNGPFFTPLVSFTILMASPHFTGTIKVHKKCRLAPIMFAEQQENVDRSDTPDCGAMSQPG